MKTRILLFFALICLGFGAMAQTSINISTTLGTPICAGTTKVLSFSLTGISSGTLTAQLSDNTGSFATPTTIGTVTATAVTTSMNVVIPNATVLGSTYAIQIIASSPATTSNSVSAITINPMPTAILPAIANTICVNATLSLTDATTGGTWSLSNNTNATISTGGTLTGMNGGIDTVNYTVNGCPAIKIITINGLPASITSSSNIVCIGSPSTFSDDDALLGTWSLSNTAIATINATGIVTGSIAGTDTVKFSYTTTGCTTSQIISINTAPSSIAPTTVSVCTGKTVTLSSATASGTWSVSSGIATVNSNVTDTGFVSGVSTGTVTVVYTYAGCSVSRIVSVNPTPNAIVGSQMVCTTTPLTFTDATSGGTWSASNTKASLSTVTPGLVTGIAKGVDTITYTVGGAGGCYTTYVVSVNAVAPQTINGAATICIGANNTTNLIDTNNGIWTNSNPSVASLTNNGSDTAKIIGLTTGNTIVSFSNGCGVVTSTIAVNQTPVPLTVANMTFCDSAIVPQIFFDTIIGTSYNWKRDILDSVGVLTRTGSGGSFSGFTAYNSHLYDTAFNTFIIYDSIGTTFKCGGIPDTFRITVNPAPKYNTIMDSVFCNGTTDSIVINGSVNTYYTWNNSNPGFGLRAFDTTLKGKRDTFSFTVHNSGIVDSITTLVITPMIAGCKNNGDSIGATHTLTVTVHPTPQIASLASNTAAYCSGSTVPAVTFNGATSTLNTYTWISTNSSIGLATTGSALSTASFTAINSGVTPISDTIKVTPWIGSCSMGSDSVFVLTVNPKPIITPITDKFICSSGNLSAIPYISNITTGNYYTSVSSNNIGFYYTGVPNFNNSFFPAIAGNNNRYDSVILDTVTVYDSTSLGCRDTITFHIGVYPIASPHFVTNSNDTSFSYIPGTSVGQINLTGSSYLDTIKWKRVLTSDTIGIDGVSSVIDSGVNFIPAFTARNGGSLIKTANIIISAHIGSCYDGTNQNIAISVYPSTLLEVKKDSTCNNTVYSYAAATLLGAPKYTWTRNAMAGISNASSASTDSTGVFNETLIDTTAFPVVDTYAFVIYIGGQILHDTFKLKVFPTAKLNISRYDTVCSGDSVKLTLQSATPGASFTWYRFTTSGILEGDNTGGTGNIYIKEPLINNTTNYVLDSTKYLVNISSYGCSTTYYEDSIRVFVKPQPIIKHNTAFFCNNLAYTDTISIPTVGTIDSILWNNISFIGNAHDTIYQRHYANTNGTDTIRLSNTYNNTWNKIYMDTNVVTGSINGCSFKDTFTNNVYPTPRLMSNNLSSVYICDSTPLNVTLVSWDTTSLPVKFNWAVTNYPGCNINVVASTPDSIKINDVLINTDNNKTDSMTYNVTSYIVGTGCTYTQSFNAVVRPQPKLMTWKGTLSDSTICSQSPVNLKLRANIIDPATTIISHNWSIIHPGDPFYNFNNTFLNSKDTGKQALITGTLSTANIHIPLTIGYYDVLSIAKSPTLGGTCLYTDTVRITVNPKPVVPIIAPYNLNVNNSTLYYQGMHNQNFTDSSVQPDDTSLIYQWTISNGDSIKWQSGSSNPTHGNPYHKNSVVSYINSGNTTLADTAYYMGYEGCAVVGTKSFTVNPTPTGVDITFPEIAVFNNNVDTLVMVCFNNTYNKYLWGFDDTLTLQSHIIQNNTTSANETNQSLVFDGDIKDNISSKVVTKTDISNYWFWVQTTQTIGTVNYVQKAYYTGSVLTQHKPTVTTNFTTIDLKVYPNPTVSDLTISLKDTGSSNIVYEMYDLKGNKVKTIVTDEYEITIAVGDLQAGNYILTCNRDGRRVATTKFIKK